MSLRASHRVKRKKQSVWTASSLSGKRDSNPRFAWALYRKLYLHPQPLGGASGVASCESSFCITKKSSPFGLLLSLSGKREFNLCSPIILGLKILRFFRFTFELRSNSFDRF